MLGFSFREVMAGTVQRPGERFDRPFTFELDVVAPSVTGLFTSVTGEATGTVRIDGLARDAAARGFLELSPLAGRRIRYCLDLTGDDGKPYRFDGHKSIDWLRAPLQTWTTLPGAVYDEAGQVWGEATLR